jgi:hypothetical protein
MLAIAVPLEIPNGPAPTAITAPGTTDQNTGVNCKIK